MKMETYPFHRQCNFQGIPSFPHAFSGNPETGTGPPIKAFGGDVLENRHPFTPTQFSREIAKSTRIRKLKVSFPNPSCPSCASCLACRFLNCVSLQTF